VGEDEAGVRVREVACVQGSWGGRGGRPPPGKGSVWSDLSGCGAGLGKALWFYANYKMQK